ncbi:MAG: TorD-like chaperone [Desulfobacteraceae bacterium]|nr:MAG: TorD-like chaperone [Desulfobacteraceae bacterium]
MMCRIFWGPDLEICGEMVQGDYHRRIESLHPLLTGPPLAALVEMLSLLKRFSEGDSLCEYLEDGYVRLFVSTRHGIKAPLYESCYAFDDAPLMGAPAAAMRERLESKGLTVTGSIVEPPDHISVELEYLYFLLQKAWFEQDRASAEEAAFFASRTMHPWVFKLRKRLAHETSCLFYPLAAHVLVALLEMVGEEEEACLSGTNEEPR